MAASVLTPDRLDRLSRRVLDRYPAADGAVIRAAISLALVSSDDDERALERGLQAAAATSPHGLFAPREIETLALAAAGLSGPETARAMHLSLDTVRDYRSRVISKLKARNITHAVHIAHQRGIL